MHIDFTKNKQRDIKNNPTALDEESVIQAAIKSRKALKFAYNKIAQPQKEKEKEE